MGEAETARSRLVWLSKLMAWLATVGMVVTPSGDVAAYLWPGTRSGLNLNVDHMDALLSDAVPLPYRLGAMALSLAGVGLTVWALWSLRRLFLRYAKGEVFAPASLPFSCSPLVRARQRRRRPPTTRCSPIAT